MADITLKLIWYRLGETKDNMADRYGRFLEWYRNFDIRQIDIVDMFFVGWIVFGLFVVATVQIYNRLFARKAPQGSDAGQRSILGRSPARTPAQTESCQWLNGAINWIYLNYASTPNFVNCWLAALNDEAKKDQLSPVTVRFDRILAGSLPPRVTNVHTEAGAKDIFNLRATLDSSELAFQVLVSQTTATNVELTNCDVIVQLLRGTLKSETKLAKDEVHCYITFEGTPEIVLVVKPHKTKGPGVDAEKVAQAIKKIVTKAVTHFKLSTQMIEGMPLPPSHLQETMQNHVPLYSSGRGGRSSETFLRQDKRLLVKIIKASGLGAKDFGCNDPYCMVEMDDPSQKHQTSVVKSTVNPFWDEHFLFDLNSHSKEITFEVFDREKLPGDDFLGMAVVSVDDLIKNPSSRQIIPLAGHTPGTGKGGNITVEFLFMDRADAPGFLQPDEQALMVDAAANLSPRRRIETNRTMMPGGLVVTTQTTSMDRPRYGSGYDESPNHGDQTEADPGRGGQGSVESSPASSRLTPPGPGGVSGREEWPSPTRGGGKSSTLPAMTESTPTEELKDDGRLSQANDPKGRDRNKPKRSSSIASTLRKRFSRNKKPRSQSADRATTHDDQHLRPPEQYGSKSTEPGRTKEHLDDVDIPGHTSNLQKSKSIGSSLKKLFKIKSRRHSNADGQGSRSRDSSVTRSRERLGPETMDVSRDSSLAQPSPDSRRPVSTTRLSTSSAV